MARKTKEELNQLMKKEGVSRLWSWSRFNSFKTSPYEYMLKYIQHIPEDRQDCIYTSMGTSAHGILERFYADQIKYQDMIQEFEDAWMLAYDIGQLKFDRNDEEKNKRISSGYYENLKHFFQNHTVLEYKPEIEQFIKFKIGDNLFTGYIDCIFKDNEENYHIIDFKTSSIYKGSKAEKESGQLVCYAIGLNQAGVPLEKIRIAWNFLKYCTIQYQQKNGEIKNREVERGKIGESLQSNAKMWLREFGYKDQQDYYLRLLSDTNNIKVLPEEVQKKYVISDCYVYIPLEQSLIDKWATEIVFTIQDIEMREAEYEATKNEKCFWDTDESVEAQSYYFATLCSYSPKLHKPYEKYLESLEDKKGSNSLFNNVGSKCCVVGNMGNTEDLSWLNDI